MITVTKPSDIAMYLLFDITKLKRGCYIVLRLNERNQIIEKVIFDNLEDIPKDMFGVLVMYHSEAYPSEDQIKLAAIFENMKDFIVMGDENFTSFLEKRLISHFRKNKA
ncbi:DNA repair protein RadC [Lysinibacillus composti]|uniref:Uncharacterized protein n=1 Tax=Lysinibacillus composti TaxID=720633 RepID=A0A3N9UJH3_9BACI|nr:hypothetical protein [Lysinibacillus composti]MBM7607254.1 DNA repair protein RadC [Lysinibacillus composti]RQW76169.1 hypothetical protein EBB45_01060 [Lysinibacillus composti]